MIPVITTFKNFRNTDEINEQLDKLIELKETADDKVKAEIKKIVMEKIQPSITELQNKLNSEMSALNSLPLLNLPNPISDVKKAVSAINDLISALKQFPDMIMEEIKQLGQLQIQYTQILAKISKLIS